MFSTETAHTKQLIAANKVIIAECLRLQVPAQVRVAGLGPSVIYTFFVSFFTISISFYSTHKTLLIQQKKTAERELHNKNLFLCTQH